MPPNNAPEHLLALASRQANCEAFSTVDLSHLRTRAGRLTSAALIRTSNHPLAGRMLRCIACALRQVWSVPPRTRDGALACFSCGAHRLRRRGLAATEAAS